MGLYSPDDGADRHPLSRVLHRIEFQWFFQPDGCVVPPDHCAAADSGGFRAGVD
jgi:hypothetical protein